MGELEHQMRAQQSADDARRREYARLWAYSKTPTAQVQQLCAEFARLMKESPVTIAHTVSTQEPQPQRRKLFGGSTTPIGGLHTCEPTGLTGWIIGHDRGLIVTPDGQLMHGWRSTSYGPRPQQNTGGYVYYLRGAKQHTSFLHVRPWPFNWDDQIVVFRDNHPRHPNQGPTISDGPKEDASTQLIRESLVFRLRNPHVWYK